jgi:hypothetical protein
MEHIDWKAINTNWLMIHSILLRANLQNFIRSIHSLAYLCTKICIIPLKI